MIITTQFIKENKLVSSETEYIVIARNLETGFGEIIGVCQCMYDAEVCRDVDIDDYGTGDREVDLENYRIVEWG